MSPQRLLESGGQVAASVGKVLSLVGGLAAFGYGTAMALGFGPPITPSARVVRLEAKIETLHTEILARSDSLHRTDGEMQREQALILRELHGIRRISCMKLTSTERSLVDVCADDQGLVPPRHP